MKEEWKDIDGYEGLYQISNKGRVKSFRQWKRASCPAEYLLKPSVAQNGYLQVTLYKAKTKRKFLIHRLVALAFVPNPNSFLCINHKDENKQNNAADNLEWCTVQYNNSYGTAKYRRLLTMSYPVAQKLASGEVIAIYMSTAIAEEITRISKREITACLRGALQSAGGFVWSKV